MVVEEVVELVVKAMESVKVVLQKPSQALMTLKWVEGVVVVAAEVEEMIMWKMAEEEEEEVVAHSVAPPSPKKKKCQKF